MSRSVGARRRAAAAACLVGALTLLAGCGEDPSTRATDGADAAGTASPDPDGGRLLPPTPLPAPAGPPEPPPPPVCRDGDPVAVSRSIVDSALGSRYLRLDVRSCTSTAVTLGRPVLTGVTATGRRGTLRVAATPVAGRPDEPFVLDAGATASAGIEWRAAPRTRRVEELRVATAVPGDVPDLLTFDVLDLRLGTRLDYYPWVARPDDVF